MFTPSFGLTATERVLPRLALDFTTASLDSRITFTRALNTATRVNSSGYIESVNADVARFDFDPVTKICKGLLIEESRANIALYSEDFTQSPWVQAQSTAILAQGTSPANTNTAILVQEDNSNADHGVYQPFNATSGVNYTVSVFAKKKDRDYVYIKFFNNNGVFNNNSVWFNISNGTVATTQSGITATIVDFGNGWYRCNATQVSGATALGYFGAFQSTADAELTYVGDPTKGTYMWGAQLELGAFSTSYIPTTTTSLTRNADVATMTGTNFSDWYSQTEGAVVAIGTGAKGQFPMAFGITETTANIDNQYCCFINNGTTPIQDIWSGGVPQVSLNSGAVITLNGRFAIASAVKTDNFAGCAVAGTVQTDNSGTLPSVMARLNLGSRNDVLQLNGWLEKFMYFPQRITNTEVQAFSK